MPPGDNHDALAFSPWRKSKILSGSMKSANAPGPDDFLANVWNIISKNIITNQSPGRQNSLVLLLAKFMYSDWLSSITVAIFKIQLSLTDWSGSSLIL